jgi:hypothetical protein
MLALLLPLHLSSSYLTSCISSTIPPASSPASIPPLHSLQPSLPLPYPPSHFLILRQPLVSLLDHPPPTPHASSDDPLPCPPLPLPPSPPPPPPLPSPPLPCRHYLKKLIGTPAANIHSPPKLLGSSCALTSYSTFGSLATKSSTVPVALSTASSCTKHGLTQSNRATVPSRQFPSINASLLSKLSSSLASPRSGPRTPSSADSTTNSVGI